MRLRNLAVSTFAVGALLTATPAVDLPGPAEPTAVASAANERVANTLGSSKAISIRLLYKGKTSDRILGPGDAWQVGSDTRITSFHCPSNTTCSYSHTGGALESRVRGPQRVNVPLSATTVVFARS